MRHTVLYAAFANIAKVAGSQCSLAFFFITIELKNGGGVGDGGGFCSSILTVYPALQNVFSFAVVADDLAPVHGYDAFLQRIYDAFVMCREDDRGAEVIYLL